MSNTNDIFQVDYHSEKKEIRINLPEEIWKNIDTVIMTRLFQEELVVEKQNGDWTDERCPKCGANLLGNKVGDKWCSLVGCDYSINAPEGAES